MSSGKNEQRRLSRKSSKASISTTSSDASRRSSRSSVTPCDTPGSGGSRRPSIKSLGSKKSIQYAQSVKAITTAEPRAVRFCPLYRSTSEAYQRLPAAERTGVFVEVTFFTDKTPESVALKSDSLFVPQQQPFKLEKGTPAYEYAVRVACASVVEHAAQGILEPGRQYAWLPLLFKVKAVVNPPNYDPRGLCFDDRCQTLDEIQNIPVQYDGKWV